MAAWEEVSQEWVHRSHLKTLRSATIANKQVIGPVSAPSLRPVEAEVVADTAVDVVVTEQS